ncbi:DoxX family protein [Actinokineospora sp. PR83]|uniref:DoxX family protein n=1 Tax=Actinokineospora sp. PR83 TaxID=2884908 RepID=UPI001F32A0C8|nr:DoxX family protein [Actinokineospora sp. PR83]MCG8915516.1 DoxX family protein [Actinokineospora sp. PR83]
MRTSDTTVLRARLTGPAVSGAVLSAVRVVVGFLFLCHGLQGFGLFGGVDTMGTAVPVGSWPGWYAGVIEVVGGALVLLGLLTRPAALVCSGAMAYAYFTVHQPMAALPLQNMGEQAVLFCWVFLLIAALGPGPFALSALRRR